MKILIISNVFPPRFIGGYELAAEDVGRYLASQGHTIEVITSDYLLNDEQLPEFSKITRSLQGSGMLNSGFQMSSGDEYLNLWNIRQISIAIGTLNPDLIMVWNIQMLGSVGILKFIGSTGIPSYLYLMDDVLAQVNPVSQEYAKFRDTFGDLELAKNFRVIKMSQNLENELRNRYGLSVKDAITIPGWIDLSGSHKINDGILHLSKKDNFKFVFSSRIAAHKGIFLVVEAVKRLAEEGVTNFSVDIFGNGEVEVIMRRVADLKLDGFIKYKGVYSKSEACSILTNYDALLFPTWPREPFGFIAIEAAAAGCIPIITQGIGAAEWLKNGVDSIKIPQSAHDLASAMLLVMKMETEDLLALKRNAIEGARLNFNFQDWMRFLEVDMKFWVENSIDTPKVNIYQLERAFAYLDPFDRSTIKPNNESHGYSLLKKYFKKLPNRLQNYLRRRLIL
jgi:glycosyltransferase involved in cell wall biosynthesis